jgi:heptosyltransferase-1
MKPALTIKKGIKEFVFFIVEGLAPFLNKNNRYIDKLEIKKILVYPGGGGIGDFLNVVPAIKCLHANFPDSTISLLAQSGNRLILPLCSVRAVITDIIDYDTKTLHNSFLKKLRLLITLRKRNYDLVYFPSRGEGMREEVLMSLIIGAPHRLGFRKGKVGLSNTVKVELKDDIPIMEQNLAILKAANLDVDKQEVGFDIPEKDMTYTKELLTKHGSNNSFPLITIHPGASWYERYRCWPLDKYISLIDILLKKFSAAVIIIGSKNEAEIGNRINQGIQDSHLLNLIGKTTISQMAAFIKVSDIFIGNDSGPLHVALSLGVPTVAIFGQTSPKQVISATGNYITVSKKIECSPCYLHQPRFKPCCDDIKCLNEISVEEVIKYFREILIKIMPN